MEDKQKRTIFPRHKPTPTPSQPPPPPEQPPLPQQHPQPQQSPLQPPQPAPNKPNNKFIHRSNHQDVSPPTDYPTGYPAVQPPLRTYKIKAKSIETPSDQTTVSDLKSTDTVQLLKTKIRQQIQRDNLPDHRFLYSGRALVDNECLYFYFGDHDENKPPLINLIPISRN
ncbi:hypothetical protein BLNAU_7921 [Blattamonas nauphoetae]|uniref:Ubiquitin-like domain-containing protein n=1 Tax=Blattamonas nauphoetae TaxID=2049346 RepID=A0ABQ9Y028_9EUKA|nr:hypothetical protein BLNAU_7921 [Blattamonas nauphoetae]